MTSLELQKPFPENLEETSTQNILAILTQSLPSANAVVAPIVPSTEGG